MADTRAELTEVASTPPFTFYEVGNSELVVAADYLPAVYEGPSNSLLARLLGVFGIGSGEDRDTFEQFSLDWYGRIELLDRWIATDGPEDWPRVASLDQLADSPQVPDREVRITNVVLEEDQVSFRTNAIGVPHLVKVSYFPNWQVKGAEGPYHAGPSFMIVVPTANEVTLTFGNTLVENLGWLLTLAGVVAALLLIVRNRLHRVGGDVARLKTGGEFGR
jgi:hypothetical protein